MSINEILKEERKRQKLTQAQVAEYLKMARPAYTLYETGTNTPTVENIIKLAELYKCSTDYLLGRYEKLTEEKTPKA